MTQLTTDDLDAIAGLIKDLVPDIVRAETADIRAETTAIGTRLTRLEEDMMIVRQVLGSNGMMLRSMRTELSELKQTARAQGVLNEDFRSDFRVVMELISDSIGVRKQVHDHEERILMLEAIRARY